MSDLMPGGSLQPVLKAMYGNKLVNLTCEDMFARASHMRPHLQAHLATTAAAKHVCSEVKSEHQQWLKRVPGQRHAPLHPKCKSVKPARKCETYKVLNTAKLDANILTSESDLVTAKRLNGWILFRTDKCRNEIQLPGESAASCHSRVTAAASSKWRRLKPAQRRAWSTAAMDWNADATRLAHDFNSSQLQELARVHNLKVPMPGHADADGAELRLVVADEQAAIVPQTNVSPASWGTSGNWGLCDIKHGIAKEVFAPLCTEKGFVAKRSRAWESSHGEAVCDLPDVKVFQI